jgi:hypothetical protein
MCGEFGRKAGAERQTILSAFQSTIPRAKPEVNWRQAPDHTDPQAGTHRDEGWMDLDREAVAETTSEAKEYPVEAALPWKKCAAGVPPMRPTIRLNPGQAPKAYTHRAPLRRNRDRAYPRIRHAMVWFREIVRPQWHFSLPTRCPSPRSIRFNSWVSRFLN